MTECVILSLTYGELPRGNNFSKHRDNGCNPSFTFSSAGA